MQGRYLFVKMTRQGIDLVVIGLALVPEFHLRQNLVGEGRRHDEGRMAGGTAEVHQAALGQHDDALAVGEFHLVDLRLDLGPVHVLQRRDLDLVVEVTDVADDRAVFHVTHVIHGDDVLVAGRGDKDVGLRRGLFHGHDLIAFHGSLQGADRIDLGNHDARAALAERCGRTLADVAITGDNSNLAGQHHVGRAADAVDQRFTAAIEVVEFRLGHGVIHIDCRERQAACLGKLVQAQNAGGGLFRHTLDGVTLAGEPALALRAALFDLRLQEFLFLAAWRGKDVLSGLGARTEQDIHGGVAAIIENHVGGAAVRPVEDTVDIFPVFGKRLALLSEHWHTGSGDGGGGLILGREDVA